MDADVLRGRDVTACYERHVRAEDGQRLLLCAVRGSVKKRGWVREELVGELFPRVARRARAGVFHQKPAGQKPRPPVAGQDELHVAVRLSLAARGPGPAALAFAPGPGPTSFALASGPGPASPTSFALAPGTCCLLCGQPLPGQPLPGQTQAQRAQAQTKWEDGDEWRIVRSHTEAHAEAAEAHTEADTHTEAQETGGGNESQNDMTLDEMLEAIRE